MIKWLGGGKPDHPLADPKEARKALAELPANDPFKALDEVVNWADSVARTEGFRLEDRLVVLHLLDEAGQQFQRKLARDYLTAPRLQKFQENRLWGALFGFWKALGDGYGAGLREAQQGAKVGDKLLLTLSACRGMRAISQQLKWLQLRYGPVDQSAWARLSECYRFAAARKIEQQAVTLYAGVPGETTVSQELLKALMLWIACPDSLVPLHIELAERLAAHLAPGFIIEPGQRKSGSHCYDLDSNRPPTRMSGSAVAGQSLVFFGPGAAYPQLERIAQQLEKGLIPADINLGATYKPGIVLEVLRHLATQWAPKPPARQHQRHSVKARMSVISGFERLLERAGDGGLSFESAESWIIENISAGGFGAVIPELKADWVRVGTLLGVRPEGIQRWGVGLIRRICRDDQNQGHIGVQNLAKEAAVVRVRPVGHGRVAGFGTDAEGYYEALLLRGPGDVEGEARLLLKPGVFSSAQSFEMEERGSTHLLIPQQLREHGEDFDLASFRLMLREQGTHEG